MKPVNIKPLRPSKAVNLPQYPERLRQAAGHFLSRVPDGLCGRQLLSLLSYGSAADIKRAGILLWDNVPDARDAANRIDALARHMMAVESYEKAKAKADAPAPDPLADPLEEAIRKAGIPMPPSDVLDVIRKAVGIKPGDKVTVELGESLKDDDHGLPMECFIALQKVLPGIRVVQRKVVSCPTAPVPLAQAILDMTLQKAADIGLN